MSTIFLDECGYTGQDLLNPVQPLFTLASLNLSESECQDLKQLFFSNVQSTELKYSSLSRRPKQQQMIIEFLKELSGKPELVKLSVAHKQYVLVTKMIEMIVEPVCQDSGINIYDRGGNISLANLMFYTLPVFGGVEFFQNLLKCFQDMIRLRTEEAYRNFFEPLFTKQYSEDLDELLGFFRASHINFGHELLDIPDHLDIAVSSTFALMFEWRKDINDDIVLVHDASSAMAKEKKIWDIIVNPNLSPIEVGYDRRKTQFPIRVVKTCSEDSKKWAGLQLVDILAGACTRCARWLNDGGSIDDTFGKELTEIVGNSFVCFSIAPQKKFTPDALGTIGDNAVSPHYYLMSLLLQNLSALQD